MRARATVRAFLNLVKRPDVVWSSYFTSNPDERERVLIVDEDDSLRIPFDWLCDVAARAEAELPQ